MDKKLFLTIFAWSLALTGLAAGLIYVGFLVGAHHWVTAIIVSIVLVVATRLVANSIRDRSSK